MELKHFTLTYSGGSLGVELEQDGQHSGILFEQAASVFILIQNGFPDKAPELIEQWIAEANE